MKLLSLPIDAPTANSTNALTLSLQNNGFDSHICFQLSSHSPAILASLWSGELQERRSSDVAGRKGDAGASQLPARAVAKLSFDVSHRETFTKARQSWALYWF